MTIETNEETKTILYTKMAGRKASNPPEKQASEPNSRKPREDDESFKESREGSQAPNNTSAPQTASSSSLDEQQTSSPSPPHVQQTSSPSPPHLQQTYSPSPPHVQQTPSSVSPSPACPKPSSSAPQGQLSIPPPLPPKQAQLKILPPLPPKQTQPTLPPPLPPKQTQPTLPPPLPPKQAQLTFPPPLPLKQTQLSCPPPLPPKQAQLTRKAKKNFEEQNLWRREVVLPRNWIPMPRDDTGNDVTVHVVKLSSSSVEYQDVEKKIYKTVHLKKIKSIERIQNPYLYQAYQLRKVKMDRDNPQANNELQLFHGTHSANVLKINTQGFDRSFTGSAHGAVYGTGVYYARDASYSLDYTGGYRKVIYFARVLVGRYCEGSSKFKKPPPITSEQPEILFDSMVNDTKIPSIFVTYYDNQCYPEYLIAF